MLNYIGTIANIIFKVNSLYHLTSGLILKIDSSKLFFIRILKMAFFPFFN